MLNKKQKKFNQIIFAIALSSAIGQPVFSQTGISTFTVNTTNPPNSSYVATSPSDAANDITANTDYDVFFGIGDDFDLVSYTLGGVTFNNFLAPDTLILQRTDGGKFVNVWYTLDGIDPPGLLDGSNTDLNLNGQEVGDPDTLYKTGSLITGYDNILVNEDDQASGSIQAQIERVDVIWYTGIASCNTTNAVFPIIERGGNDSIKVAAITGIDANGTPTSYGSMVDVVDSDFPGTGLSNNNYLILRRQTVGQNPLPLLNIGTIAGQTAQVIQGVGVSFSELGIGSGEVIYGYSLFAYDTNANDHDLTDISTFPTDTKAATSGIDLVAGLSAAVSSDNCLTRAVGPGGYKSGLNTWLKANETDDVTTSTEGATVSDWQDHWIGNHDFTTDGTAPVYRSTSSTINFNQSVDFTGTDRGLTTANNDDFNTADNYERKGLNLAFRTNSADVTTRQVLYEQGGGSRGINFYIESGNLNIHAWNRTATDGSDSPWNNADNTISTSITNNTEYILTFELNGNSNQTGTFTAYLNGQSFGTISNVGRLYGHTGDITLGRSGGNTRYSDGTSADNNSFKGEIPEFIYCNEPGSFPVIQRNRIESYLALKYGVTLNQTSPYNYVNSSGEIIFNTTLNASLGGYLEFNKDIAGIGRDDASEFEQQVSKSENANSIITVDHGGNFSANNTWFIWGNDNGAANDLSQAADVPSIIANRIERVWRIAETGETNSNSIIFDLNQLTFNNSPITSDLSLLIANNGSDGDFSSATIITGGILNGSTLTFNDVNLSNGQYFSLGTGFIECGPGGVTNNLSLWLKADLGPNATSGEVTSWEDQAGSNTASGITGSVPNYLNNAINFNPALDFDDTNGEELSGSAGFNSSGYYVVLNTDLAYNSGTTNEALLEFEVPAGADDQFGSLLLGSATGAFAGEVVTHAIGGTGNRWRRGISETGFRSIAANETILLGIRNNSTNNSTSISFNGINEEDLVSGTFLTSTDVAYRIGGNLDGNTFLDDNFNGQISEVISFSSRPSDSENSRIQTYLALKYGITLSQSSPQNYVSSNSSVIWNATSNSNYNNDIAGIGRDDDSCLSQRQSKSANSGTIVTIGLGGIFVNNAANTNSFLADNSFLVWGNDGDNPAQANANTLDVPGNVTERIETIWRVEENGTVGNTSISFDLSGLGYTSIASNFQLIISGSSTMANGQTITGGTFDGNVLTFDDVDFEDGDYFTLGTNRVACGPGGVTADIALWLKANEGTNTTTDEANLTTWTDFSGNNRSGLETDLGGVNPVEPTYQESEINFNPTIEFLDPNSTNASYIETINGNNVANDFTIVAVFKTGQNGGDTGDFENSPILIGTGTAGTDLDYGLGLAEGRLHLNAANDDNLTLRTNAGTTYIDMEPYIVTATRVQSTGALALYLNSAFNASGTGSTNVFSNPTAFGIGNNPSPTVGSQYNGNLAEAIVFADDLNATERQQVESYLAIKYGINRNTTANYLASDGGIIWNYTSDANYNNDIAGIGRDDDSCLAQLKSKSENNDAIVTMEIASLNTDDSFLLWGNDNATLEDPDNSEYNSSQVNSRLNREWHVQETGTIGNVTLTFDVSNITGPNGTGSNNLNLLRLMVDGDGDFSSGVNLLSPSSINSSSKTVSFTVNFQNSEYFTLGSEEIGALPVELIAFGAFPEKEFRQVQVEWTSSSETEHSAYKVERSSDGNSFEALASLEGKGDSEFNTYLFKDEQPLLGTSYYRLKMMDNTGEEYSEVKSVKLYFEEESSSVLFPNPVFKGSKANLSLYSKQHTNVLITVHDVFGKSLYTEEKSMDAGVKEIPISTEGLERGIYLIQVIRNKQTETFKLIVK